MSDTFVAIEGSLVVSFVILQTFNETFAEKRIQIEFICKSIICLNLTSICIKFIRNTNTSEMSDDKRAERMKRLRELHQKRVCIGVTAVAMNWSLI